MNLTFVDAGEKTMELDGATIRYVEALQMDRSACYAAAMRSDAGQATYDPGEFARALFARCVRGWEGITLNGEEWTPTSTLRVRERTYKGAEVFVLFDEIAGPLLKAILGGEQKPEEASDDANP